MSVLCGLPKTPKSQHFDVTLAGDTDLDILFYGLPEQLPLEQELLATGMAIRLGGSGAITAHNLAALGNAVGFITADAGDDFGRQCHSELSRAGVDLSHCVPAPGEQTGVTVHLQHEQHRHMLTCAGATFRLTYDDLDLDYLSDTRHFHMSSYFLQRSLTPRIPELFRRLRRTGATISLDPNDDPAQEWSGGIAEAIPLVDILMPNEREACKLTGVDDIDQAVEKLRVQVPLLVIKRGPRGASAYTAETCWHAPAVSVVSVDAIGAGDSFNAGFLHGWLRGWPIMETLDFANLTGAWSTTASGGASAFRSSEAVRGLLGKWQDIRGGKPAAVAHTVD